MADDGGRSDAEVDDAEEPGSALVNLAFLGTGAVVATSVVAAIAPDSFGVVHAGLSVVLFVVGTASMLWAYALGVSRSRSDLISVPGLFFLSGGAAPPSVRRALRVATAVQVVAVVAAASVRPYTEVAFGILAPMFGLGLMGMWGGRHGDFPDRPRKEGGER